MHHPSIKKSLTYQAVVKWLSDSCHWSLDRHKICHLLVYLYSSRLKASFTSFCWNNLSFIKPKPNFPHSISVISLSTLLRVSPTPLTQRALDVLRGRLKMRSSQHHKVKDFMISLHNCTHCYFRIF